MDKFLAKDKSIRSNTSVCLSVDLPEDKIKMLVNLLAEEKWPMTFLHTKKLL